MSTDLLAVNHDETGRWAPVQRAYDWPRCKYCGRASQDSRACERVTCALCGVAQCKASSTCAICFVGYLPGFSRRDNRDGVSFGIGSGLRFCSYKGCDGEAVTMLTKSRAACMAHVNGKKPELLTKAHERIGRLHAGSRQVRWHDDRWAWVA